MKDLDTTEELVFPFRRWLSRDEDDGEICRELPAIRPQQAILPGKIIYNIYSKLHKPGFKFSKCSFIAVLYLKMSACAKNTQI